MGQHLFLEKQPQIIGILLPCITVVDYILDQIICQQGVISLNVIRYNHAKLMIKGQSADFVAQYIG